MRNCAYFICRFRSRHAMSAHIWWPSSCGHLSSSPGVLRRMAYLVPVVAGCDCSWRWRSGAQAASCSAGGRMPTAECGRMVPTQWTHSAVATTGGVDVLPRALVTDQLGLVQGVQSLGQSKAERSPPSTPPRRPPRTRPGRPVANRPVLHPTVASDAPGP